jgi:hypothetical protein
MSDRSSHTRFNSSDVSEETYDTELVGKYNINS